jgi:hypothetical protein
VHVNNGYRYASTQPPFLDPVTGEKKYRRIHWGRVVDGGKFIPGDEFWLASPEERARLIFPDGWDLTEISQFTGLRHPGRPCCDNRCTNSLYGHVWLLERIAESTGLRKDLEAVFGGNSELADDILTLAMFPYLTSWTYNRVARWQRDVKTPSSRELTPTAITRLAQAITERHRVELLRLRGARLDKGELCGVDSTSRSTYGKCLAEIRWGKNKERLPLEQTTEVVAYALSSHMPVYYRSFQGNIPDSRTLGVMLADLDHAGFKKVVLITDRGFETLRNLEKHISRGQPMIMCTTTSKKDVAKAIEEMGALADLSADMELDPDEKLYHRQYDVDYQVKGKGSAVATADRLKMNLYLDTVQRARDLMEVSIALGEQRKSLEELVGEEIDLDDYSAMKSGFNFFKVDYDPAARMIKTFEVDDRKVARAKKNCGFFSIMTHKVDFDAMTTLHNYRLRDEQEKCFQQMKDQMVSDRHRSWSEEGKAGRLLILFVGLILSSVVRHVWKSTKMRDLFKSSLEMVDEMRAIRCVEHPHKAMVITPFVGRQLEICEAFGFGIPENCAPIYTSRQTKVKRGRGRPPKKRVELDY